MQKQDTQGNTPQQHGDQNTDKKKHTFKRRKRTQVGIGEVVCTETERKRQLEEEGEANGHRK